ncbi:MAG: serine/threonine-protein kinase [Dokdonella sp.]|nr:serine/threonine protein kinase [Dokdonella sp.]MCB1571508.1 serine/threonine protein kinase [Xanthomonadales bacterium]MCB1573188.1 serine/threonine protein kinase [Xanthomonadales bacterium]
MNQDETALVRRAAELFDHLLDLPDDERDGAIDRLADTPALGRRLRRLLKLHREPGILDSAALHTAAVPTRIGSWTILGEIGRGGMAVVYRAERSLGESTQVAALKVLTVGALAANGREGFLREQAILARLDHPHIVGLLDAGVLDDGTPWLAMALVDGERIDTWCDQRARDTREIVTRFLDICSAVAYAHRNLVVHRDLKPSNILVDSERRVRLLDFGIARLLEDSGDDATATAFRALTPRYAAPEQFGSEPTTTLTDIFGLGAVLYALLAGRPPRDTASSPQQAIGWPSRSARANDQWPPAQRRQRARELHGDLDTIVLKALAPEPNRRYPTVEALAADLRAWLEHLPISARPASAWYLASRFVRRNRLVVATAVAALALSTLSVWQVVLERNRAEAQAKRATEVRDFLAEVFSSAEPSKGPIPSLLDVLDEGSRRAREELLLTAPLAAADVLTITGGTYLDSGVLEKSATDLAEARDILEETQPRPAAELSRVYTTLGMLARRRGDNERSLDDFGKGLSYAKQSGAPAQAILRIEVSMSATENNAGRPAEAEVTLRKLLREIRAHELSDTPLHLDALNALGTSLALQKRAYPEQAALHEQRLAVTRALYGTENGWYAYALADAVPTFRKAGQIARAESLARESTAIADRLYSAPHIFASVAYCNLAALLQHEGKLAEALAASNRNIGMDEAMKRADPHAESCRRSRAYLRAALSDYPAALSDLAVDRSLLEQLGKQHSTLWMANCGLEASIWVRSNEVSRAEEHLSRCSGGHSPNPSAKVDEFDLARVEIALARNDGREAEEWLTGLRDRLPPDPSSRAWLRPWLLSVLAADAADDRKLHERLVSAIRSIRPVPGMADLSVIEPCLADRADVASCMILP